MEQEELLSLAFVGRCVQRQIVAGGGNQLDKRHGEGGWAAGRYAPDGQFRCLSLNSSARDSTSTASCRVEWSGKRGSQLQWWAVQSRRT